MICIREVFHDKYGIELEDEAVSEWRDFEAGLHDRMDMGSGVSLQSPQEIIVSISDLRASEQDVRREFEDNKSVIRNQTNHFAIADEGSAEYDKFGDFQAKFTIKYTGSGVVL